jgi:hypothetical protein
MSRDTTLLENITATGVNADGLYLCHSQMITQDFLDHLQSQRLAQADIRGKDYHAVATVPTSVIELWGKQGLDFWRMSAREIAAKLRKDDLHAFLATPKSV